jgi:hypothetical protein
VTRCALFLALLVLAACSTTCRDPEQLAELAARVGGEVERDEASTQGKWHDARLGTLFRVGDGLRTGAQSSAELALLPSGSANVSPHSVVRFMATPPRDPSRHVALEVGELEILAEQIDLDVHTPRAVAMVSRGSKLKLSMRDGRERFDLVVGRVVLAYAGVERTLEPAQPLELNAANELVPATPAPLDAGEPVEGARLDAGDAAASAAPSLAQEDAADQVLVASSPSALRLSTLESATLHVASTPVEVLLPADACGTGGQLTLDGQPLTRAKAGLRFAAATAALTAGSHRVLLACPDGSQHEARLLVKRDPARLELPRRAQSVRVEADGRRYTVRYQNLLPDLTFVWPGEAEASPYTLVLRSGPRELTRSLSAPEHVLAGAALGEGEHKFWFRDANGRSSKPTTLRLAFDNTARSAYLSRPLEGGLVNEGPLPVEGAALVASKVSVQGTLAKLDEQGRFREEVLLAPGQKAVSVRVEHPSSGVHYYLRRLR